MRHLGRSQGLMRLCVAYLGPSLALVCASVLGMSARLAVCSCAVACATPVHQLSAGYWALRPCRLALGLRAVLAAGPGGRLREATRARMGGSEYGVSMLRSDICPVCDTLREI